jgi:hypothetical protein
MDEEHKEGHSYKGDKIFMPSFKVFHPLGI